ncbi:MAG: hypothetical protein HY000_06590 [Planctomycetes bacterium]|nr:hypothetical protein [Planctomycetota bacterium]
MKRDPAAESGISPRGVFCAVCVHTSLDSIVVPPISMSAERVQGVIHPRHMDCKTSGLEFTVKPGPNNFTITVAKP